MPVGKRELASYLLLLSLEREEVSLEEAREVLSIILPRKAIRSVLRILAKSGFIELLGARVRVKQPREALESYLTNYIRARVERSLRSRNIQFGVKISSNGKHQIEIKDPRATSYKGLRLGFLEIIGRDPEESTQKTRG
jgi:hypothetical protein